MSANILFVVLFVIYLRKEEIKIYKTIILPVILYASESGFLIKKRT